MNIFANTVSLFFQETINEPTTPTEDIATIQEIIATAQDMFSDDHVDAVHTLEWCWIVGCVEQGRHTRRYNNGGPFFETLHKLCHTTNQQALLMNVGWRGIANIAKNGYAQLTEYFKPRYLNCLAFCKMLKCHEDEAIFLFIASMMATPQKRWHFNDNMTDGAQHHIHDQLSKQLTGKGLEMHRTIRKYDIFEKYRLFTTPRSPTIENRYACKLAMLPLYLCDAVSVTPESFLNDLVTKVPKSKLDTEDFLHVDNVFNVVKNIKALNKVHLCVYGRAGGGKTEFVRWMACQLWSAGAYQVDEEVTISDVDERLTLLVVLGNLLPDNAVMVVDEMDTLLNPPPIHKEVGKDQRSKLLSILENIPCSVIWIGNIRPVDEAVRRRMSLVLKMPPLPKTQRQKLINKIGGFGENLGSALANVDRVTPAILATAGAVAKAHEHESEAAITAAVKLVISGVCLDTHTALNKALSERIPEYDPSLVNSDIDYLRILEMLKKKPAGSFLFHGISGTGKTEFAQQLARDLDVPIVAMSASDTVSSHVGETEKNIRDAFEKASSEGAILLINEAETFLRARDGVDGRRSPWLIDRTNEVLNQMEVFDGIVIATLNNHDMLDRAFLRRFDITTEFKGLRDDQICKYLSHRFSYKFSSDPAVWQTILRREKITSPVTVGMLSKLLRSDRFKDYLLIGDVLSDLKTLANDLSPDARNSVGFIQHAR